MTDTMEMYIMRKMEEKLMELMGADYYAWAKEIAKDGFRKAVEESPSEDFKKMVFDNWDEITK